MDRVLKLYSSKSTSRNIYSSKSNLNSYLSKSKKVLAKNMIMIPANLKDSSDFLFFLFHPYTSLGSGLSR